MNEIKVKSNIKINFCFLVLILSIKFKTIKHHHHRFLNYYVGFENERNYLWYSSCTAHMLRLLRYLFINMFAKIYKNFTWRSYQTWTLYRTLSNSYAYTVYTFIFVFLTLVNACVFLAWGCK